MVHSRRDAILLGLASSSLALPSVAAAREESTASTLWVGGEGPAATARWRVGGEGQRLADLGDGKYMNPVLSGDRPDPNILKDGKDYYAAFSSFQYYPAVVIWHSRDLVNWSPIGPALKTPLGSVWALDIAKHEDRYFVYIPVLRAEHPDGLPFRIYVVHSTSMHGPWSDPIDMDIAGFIDPGHGVGEDGRRYLFLNGGHRVRISADGLRRDGPIEQVYGGWPIPEDWVIEGMALEGPKLLRRGEWFYLFSGEGGTAGPPTSHMVVVARSRSINGPWENCPNNPIVHTQSRNEPWWSRGHGTAVEGPYGDWWLAYHGYENGHRSLGRQMLLEPMIWTADGWPQTRGGNLSRALPMPSRMSAHSAGFSLSGPFRAQDLGSKLAFYAPKPNYLERAKFEGGALILEAQGDGPATASPLAFVAGDRGYHVTVEVELHGASQGGLLLFYDDKLFCGLGAEADKLHAYKLGKENQYPSPGEAEGGRMALRVINNEDVATFFIRYDDKPWRKIISFEVSGYNQNMADGFMSLRPAIFASGSGQVMFRNLAYAAIKNT